MITVLIRTSYRPLGFARALASVPKECRLIVSYDNEDALAYIPDYIEKIRVYKSDQIWFYDSYCNILKSKVTEGYFMFLDDDDYIITLPTELKEDYANIVQLQRRDTIRPINADFKAGQIGMPCLILHSRWKDLADIPSTGQGDYHWIRAVCDKLPINFQEIVCVGSDQRGFGRPEVP